MSIDPFRPASGPQDDPGEMIKFPVTCHYKVLAFTTAANVEADLAEIIGQFRLDTKAEKGNLSRHGTYRTWDFSCTIPDLETLRALGAALSAIEGVKVVL